MSAVHRDVARLVRSQRWAALATVDTGAPSGAMVAYARTPAGDLLFLLSQLSAHTRHLLADPRAALVVFEPDDGEGDPQRLARASLKGRVEVLSRGTAEFDQAAMHYVDALPDALPRFELGDFVLFRFVPDEIRWVGGLARAATVGWEEVRRELTIDD